MYGHQNYPRGQILTYEDYYAQQAGNGISPHWFKGAPYQRGHGIGSFLGGLFRTALPLLKKGGIALGKELLNGGINILTDVDGGSSFKDAAKNRLSESTNNLKRKATDEVYGLLSGKGYKSKKHRKTSQSKKKPQRRRSKKARQVGKGVKKSCKRGQTKTIKRRKTVTKKRGKKKNTRSKYNLITPDIFS